MRRELIYYSSKSTAVVPSGIMLIITHYKAVLSPMNTTQLTSLVLKCRTKYNPYYIWRNTCGVHLQSRQDPQS